MNFTNHFTPPALSPRKWQQGRLRPAIGCWLGVCVLLLAGCTGFSNQKLADNLSDAMLNQNDPETVRAGAPAYLLLIDSIIQNNPQDRQKSNSAPRAG